MPAVSSSAISSLTHLSRRSVRDGEGGRMIGTPVRHQTHLLSLPQDPLQTPEFSSGVKEQECVYLLKRCKKIEEFKQVHAQVIKFGLFWSSFSASSLLTTCALSGWQSSMDYACSIFRQIDDMGTFEFNTMIRGYVKESSLEKALEMYDEMLERGVESDSFTYPALLKACAWLKALKEGMQIHGHVVKLGHESDVYVQNSLINMYGRCGEITLSRKVFEKMDARTVASWSSVIAAHAGLGMWGECLALFTEMYPQNCGKPEESTLVSVLSACANVCALDLGKCIHGYMLRNIRELNTAVKTSLVDMYAKCGWLDKATHVFKKMKHKNNLSYSAMITGLAMYGGGVEALSLFSQMLVEGLIPDDVIYVGVLTACSHCGLVKEGLQLFERMKEEHKIKPTLRHYGCMVDLLGRAGRLKQALSFIQSMPVEPNDVIWRSFLNSCRIHHNVELGEIAAKKLFQLNSNNAGDYLVLSSMYARDQRWEDVARIQTEMDQKGLTQTPACCSVEAGRKIHKFVSEDKSHQQNKDIYEMIHQMEWQLRFEGYSADTSQVLLDVDEEKKREKLKAHSQKLAIAFGLIHTPPVSTIRIARNLRMCRDCHMYTKMISMIYEREIVVKERKRFHHFKGGACSCNDYW